MCGLSKFPGDWSKAPRHKSSKAQVGGGKSQHSLGAPSIPQEWAKESGQGISIICQPHPPSHLLCDLGKLIYLSELIFHLCKRT